MFTANTESIVRCNIVGTVADEFSCQVTLCKAEETNNPKFSRYEPPRHLNLEGSIHLPLEN